MIILGCSPMMASRQFGDRAPIYRRQFSEPGGMEAIWTAFTAGGGEAVHLVDADALWRRFTEWREGRDTSLRVFLTLRGDDVDRWLASLADVGGVALLDGRSVDAGADAAGFRRAAEELGLAAGLVTNDPRWAVPLDGGWTVARPLSATVAADASLAHGGSTIAMMTLDAGALSFPGATMFAARRSAHQMVGCSSPGQATALSAAATDVASVARLRDAPLAVVASAGVDVMVDDASVTFLRDHQMVRLSDGAARVWRLLQGAPTTEQLVATVAAESRRDRSLVEVDLLPVVALLLRWRVLIADTADA